MRPWMAALLAIMALLLGLALGVLLIEHSPKYHAQLHNAYWPYSVETSVHDR